MCQKTCLHVVFKYKMRLCFANMGIDMKGQLTFCLAFYATNPSFLPVFVPPQFVHQKIVLTRAEIYFVRGGWQGKKSVH